MLPSEVFGCREYLPRVAELSPVLVVRRALLILMWRFRSVVLLYLIKFFFLLFCMFSHLSPFPVSVPGSCLNDPKLSLPNGRSFIGDATFSSWSSLYCVDNRDLYRGLRDRFDAYFLEQMDNWRHRMGTLSK